VGGGVTTEAPPKASIELTSEEIRVLAKSVSRSLDAAHKKLNRPNLRPGTPVHDDAKHEYAILDSIEQEVRHAAETLIHGR
jgi:hypothetical protein